MKPILILFFTLIYSFGFAQDNHCTINGVITDSKTNKVIPFATIKYQQTKSVTADINGKYTLKLTPGEYTLEVSAVGYKTATKKLVIPNLLSSRLIDFKLIEKDILMDEFVVSAGKYEQKLSEVTVSMEVIDKSLVENKATTNSKDIIAQVPSLHIQENQVSIRGGAGFSYGAGSRVLLLVDGMPLLTGDAGSVNWNYLPIENLKKIEIIKGASSVLYGSSALNGVIHLRTSYPGNTSETKINLITQMYDKPFANRDLKWWNGYRGTQAINFYHARQVNKNFDLVIGGNFFNDQSYKQEESEKRGRLNVNTRFRSQKYEGLSYGININTQMAKEDLFFVWKNKDSVFTPSPNTGSSVKNNRINIDPYIEYFTKNGDKHSLKNRWFNTQNLSQTNESQSSTANLFFSEYQFQKNIDSSFRITSGTSFTKSLVNSKFYGNHNSSNFALYSQLDKKFFGKLNVSIGVRGESFKLDREKQKLRPVFRSGINYQVAKFTFLRASFGQGYRFPSIAEKFASTNVGSLKVFPNPGLQSESGWSAEVGVKQGIKIGKWQGFADVSVFINEYENMTEYTFGFYDTVTYNPIPPNGDIKNFGASSRNVQKARITGIDFSLAGKGKIGNVEITILAGYTFMNPKALEADSAYLSTFSSLVTNYQYDKTLDLNSDTVSNNLKYRFNHLAKADIQLDYKKISFGFSWRYNSYVHNIDQAFNVLDLFSGNTFLGNLNEYRTENRNGTSIFDARLAYKFSKLLKLNFVVNNLMNVEYSTRPGWVMPPRTFVIQMGISL